MWCIPPDKNAEFVWRMEHVLDIANFIDRMQTGPSVIASCQNFWRGYGDFPQQTVEAALAFLEDVEAVMK